MSASSKSSTHSIIESKHHHQQAFETLYDMRSNGELCDITLKAGNLTLPAHKTVLAATSPYFRKLFTSTEEEGSEICLPRNIKPDMMAVVLEFLYTGNLRVDIKNIEDLLDAACLVKNDEALHTTVENVLSNINRQNCLRLQQCAKANNLYEMLDKVERFIEYNFEFIAKDKRFLELEAKNLRDIIQRDSLRVAKEEIVYDAVYLWYTKDRTGRREVVEWVFQEVRFDQIPESVLREKIIPELQTEDICSKQIDKALEYHRDPDNQPHRPRQELLSLYIISRKDSIVERFEPIQGACVPCYSMVPIDDQDGEYRCAVKIADTIYTVFESRVEKYDVMDKSWRTVGPGLDTRGAGVCPGKNCIYVVGGRMNSDGACKYDVKKSTWAILPTMPISRRLPGIALIGPKLYVIGGYNEKDGPLSSVHCYNVKKGEWTLFSPLNVARFQFSVVVINNAIYVIGGRDNNHTLSSIEVLETKKKHWTLLESGLIEARNDFTAVAYGNDIYCFGGLGAKTVEKFDTMTHEAQIVGNTGINNFAIDGILYKSI